MEGLNGEEGVIEGRPSGDLIRVATCPKVGSGDAQASTDDDRASVELGEKHPGLCTVIPSSGTAKELTPGKDHTSY